MRERFAQRGIGRDTFFRQLLRDLLGLARGAGAKCLDCARDELSPVLRRERGRALRERQRHLFAENLDILGSRGCGSGLRGLPCGRRGTHER